MDAQLAPPDEVPALAPVPEVIANFLRHGAPAPKSPPTHAPPGRQVLGLMVVALLFLGCRSEPFGRTKSAVASSASPSPSATAALVSAGPTDAEVQAFLDAPAEAGAKFTPALQEALLLKLEACALDGQWPAASCEPFKRWRRATAKASLQQDPDSKTMALKHLASGKPAVQCVAASIVGESWGPDMSDALIAAAQVEREPAVVACFIRHGHTSWATSPSAKIAPFLVAMAEHADVHVRKRALDEILRPPSRLGKSMPNAVVLAARRLDSDPMRSVRAHICQHLYDPEDERAVPLMERAFMSPDAHLGLATACFEGIVSAWAQRPRRQKPSRAAYELTLKLIERKPRGDCNEFADGLAALGSAEADAPGEDEAAWTNEVEPWLDRDRLRAALEDLAGDRAVSETPRYAALTALDQLQAPAEAFARVRARCRTFGDPCRGRESGELLDRKAGR